jgi:hypothetical protein
LRHHPQRICVLMQDEQRRSRELQFDTLHELFAKKNIDWQSALRTILPELPLEFRESILTRDFAEHLLPGEVVEILIESIATEKGLSSHALLDRLQRDRIATCSGGRLDRLGLPKPMVRGLRRVFHALGKRY